MSTWTDELREQAVALYLEGHPTPETSTEIVTDVADEMNFSPNSVRMILSKAGVYVAKTPTASKSTSSGGSKRVNKQEALESLRTAITDAGKEVDEEIVGKLTGKAAIYFTSLLS